MRSVRALVLSGYGINCEREMARAAREAGFEVTTAHTKAYLTGSLSLSSFDFLLLPGGFSFGDELGAAKAFANRILFSQKIEDFFRFIEAGKCILGVCNGFQLLVKLGILPHPKANASLWKNSAGKFVCRWVQQKVLPSRSIFTRNLESLYLPIRHGEGNFIVKNAEQLFRNQQVALQYATRTHNVAEHYPDNPNGSCSAIAGICDATGRVLGMMPHPEAALFFTQLPDWTRQKEMLARNKKPLPFYGPGFALFQNAFHYLRQR